MASRVRPNRWAPLLDRKPPDIFCLYHLWRKDGLEPAIALHQAQQWMSRTTAGEKAQYCGFITQNCSDRTYVHPFHWAAFSYLGV